MGAGSAGGAAWWDEKGRNGEGEKRKRDQVALSTKRGIGMESDKI
jgi:hypothetical protein